MVLLKNERRFHEVISRLLRGAHDLMGSETDFEYEITETENKKEKIPRKVLKNHACPYLGCQAAFNRPWKLNRHINVHTKERPFKCDFPGCTKDYTNKSHLDRHKCTSHAKNKPIPVHIPCPYPDCNKVFLNKWSVKRHCNTHKGKDTYNCDECGISFKKYRQLKCHLFAHFGLKPFICETCKQSFQTHKELKHHKRKHKIYICENQNCQQQFSTWNALRKHIKLLHATVYSCNSCNKTFKNKWTLTEHVLSHLPHDKREIFTCPHNGCKRFYFHQRNLEFHLKSFHRDINHKCEICGQSFVKMMNLKKHQLLQHSELKTLNGKMHLPQAKKQRKPRSDKGKPRKSMAALLSGIVLPDHIDKKLAQNNITPEVLDCIQSIREAIFKDSVIQAEQAIVN